MAGKGTEIGRKFEELRAIIDRIVKKKIWAYALIHVIQMTVDMI